MRCTHTTSETLLR